MYIFPWQKNKAQRAAFRERYRNSPQTDEQFADVCCRDSEGHLRVYVIFVRHLLARDCSMHAQLLRAEVTTREVAKCFGGETFLGYLCVESSLTSEFFAAIPVELKEAGGVSVSWNWEDVFRRNPFVAQNDETTLTVGDWARGVAVKILRMCSDADTVGHALQALRAGNAEVSNQV